MKREKLIFVVVFMVCSFIGGRLFAAYELQKPTWCVVDCGLNDTIGTVDYADGLDEGDGIGYRLDSSIGPLGEVNWEPETPSGTIVESGFYHIYYSTWIENPRFVFDDNEISSTTIRFKLESDNPAWTQYAIAFSSAVDYDSLFKNTTSYINKDGDIVTSWNEAEDWNPASFYEEIELTSLHPNTIYGFKIKSKLPPEIPPTDWSGDTGNPTWTHIETPGIMVELCITSATVRAVGQLSNLYVEDTRINFGIDDDWAGYIPDTSCTFTGLSPNTSYMFKVQARNGEQDETDVVSMSTYTLCHPPQNPYITDISSTSLTLFWEEPSEGGAIYYRIRENGSLIANEYTELSLHRPDLSVNEEYTYKIYAVNKATQTHDMSSVTISTYTFCSIPPAPQIVDISSDTIRIVIEPGDNPDHTEYSIKVSSAVGFASYVQDDYARGDYEVFQTRTIWGSPLTIINLGSNVEYTISVQASNKYNNVTGYGASVSSCTYAAVPRLEIEQNVIAGTVQITILEGNNSPETEYAIYEEWNDGGGWADRGYLQYPGGSTNPNPDWQTKATWEGSQGFFEVKDLNLTNYQFRFKAKARRTIPGYSKEDTVEIQGPVKGWSPYVYAGNIYISITDPPDGAYLRGEQTIRWDTGAGISSVNIYLGPELIGSTSDDKFSFDTRDYDDGGCMIKVAKSDQETIYAERQYTIDNTTPTITDVDINPNPVNQDYLEAYGLSINFNIIDANVNSEEIKGYLEGRSCEIEEDPDFYHDYAAIPPPPYDYISEGANTVHLYAEDLAGNTTDFYSILVYDNQAPTGTISGLEVFVSSITISVDASDDWQQIGSVVNYIEYNYINRTDLEETGWIEDNSYIYTGLLPNTEYNLEVELRDAAGNENTSAISISTSTLCAPPGRPSIKEVYISSMTVKIQYGGNPEKTRFSLAISSSAVTYYVKPNGSFKLYETTATYSDWGEESGVTITGLNPSTQYTLKCRAMDNSGVFTSWSDTRIVSTLCEPIGITAFNPDPPQEYHSEWTNVTDFKFVLTGASSYYYILSDVSTSPADYPEEIDGSEVDISTNSGVWYVHFKGENPSKTSETMDYYRVRVDTISPEIDENIEAKFLDEVHDEVLHEEDEHTCHSPTFTCEATDTLSGVAGYSFTFSTDSTDEPDVIIDTITASIELKLTELYENGTYYFRVRAIDNAGNSSQDFAEFEYKYKRDWVPPEATIEIVHKIRRGDEVKGVEETNALPNIPKIIFTEEVLSQGVKNNVEVELIRDNEGKEYKDKKVSCEISSSTVLSWKADPGEDWKSNHTYKVKVKKGIVDKATNSLKEGKELIFTTMLDRRERNVVLWESDKKARMILEQNALQEDGYILIGLWDEVENGTKEAIIDADEKVKRTGDRYCYDLHESLREMRGYTREGEGNEMEIERFLKSVYIELPYGDEDNNGIVDSTEGTTEPVREQTLSIYWLDEKHNLWVKVPGTKVNKKENVAKAKVIGFGIYTLMGASFYDLSEAYAYPVPYKPNDGNDLTGTEEEGITFTGLSSKAEIEIYTITGELVKTLEHDDTKSKEIGQEEWYPVENEKGEKVVSGVYIYYIKNDKEHKSGKLMIIR